MGNIKRYSNREVFNLLVMNETKPKKNRRESYFPGNKNVNLRSSIYMPEIVFYYSNFGSNGLYRF